MKALELSDSTLLKSFATIYDISPQLLKEYYLLFQANDIPISHRKKRTKDAKRIVMISTHGYWGDPPPAGVPDTGGQTYYVLEVSKAWARQGRKVIILARWFKPYPRVEAFAKNLWLVRIRAGGDEFVRKEDIYPLVPEMAEAATAVSLLFGAQAVMGHYAEGMAGAVEVGERLKIPAVVIPHSMGISKVKNLGFDPYNPEMWLDPQYNFWIRESFELFALKGANLEIANTPTEPVALKDYYGAEFPHLIMPAGAGKDFFQTYKKKPGADFLSQFELFSKKYIIFFGRLSEAKNIPGAVAVLGEARRLDPPLFNKMKLAIVGGNPENPNKEEFVVRNQISDVMKKYKLNERDVVMIPSLDWKRLSILAHHSLFYVGMQMLEPFGMGAAEAMAAGTAVMISRFAGITKWLKQRKHALIVDPQDPGDAARILVKTAKDKNFIKKMSLNGHRLAQEMFSWVSIARHQGELIDKLHQGKVPRVMNNKRMFLEVFSQRENRAYHRLAFVWRGDPPIIRVQHKKAAKRLAPHIQEAAMKVKRRRRRVVVALGGESGVGKSEVAEYLKFLLRREGIWALTLPGDAFFKLTPAQNHQARLKAYHEGRLKEYLGPSEVDIEKLNSILNQAVRRGNKKVFIPSDCRRLHSRRYENVPVDLTGVDVIFIDLTYSVLLKNANLKVFFESDYKKRLQEIKERNIARDPDQDFTFILKVLEIEHRKIQKLRKEADLIITNNYEVATPH